MSKFKKGALFCLIAALSAVCLILGACGGKITFTFETNCDVSVESVQAAAGEEVTLPDPPAREGYSFEGWYSDAAFSGSPVTTEKASQNRTFYAKWEKLYKITLDAGEGTLPATSLYLKAGETISSALEGYVPTRGENYLFGEWLRGTSPLTGGEKMPAEDITLTAHYQVKYTVEVFVQSLEDPESYEQEEDVVGYAYATSDPFVPSPGMKGLRAVSHDGEVRSKVLSESDPSQNVYRIYFDREQVIVSLESNYPDEETPLSVTLSGVSGQKTVLPEELFYATGYLLVGWSTEVGGEAVIPSNVLSKYLYGNEPELYEYVFEENCALYAVWQKGYIDRFEGTDSVFLLEDGVYLERGGLFFKGEYTEANSSFLFNGDGKTPIEGVLNDDGTFTYYNESRVGSKILYSIDKGVDENTTIVLDDLDGITYRVEGETGAQSSRGHYRYGGNGNYVATFTEGSLQGTEMTFTVGYITLDGVSRPAFQIRDDVAYSLGIIPYGAVNRGQLTYYPNNLYALQLNGYGFAAMLQSDGTIANYYYRLIDDTIYLYDRSSGQLVETDKLMKAVDDTLVYFPYTASQQGEYLGENGESLTLDGTCNATYRSESGEVRGLYTVMSSAFGGLVVTVTSSNGGQMLFRTSVSVTTVDDQSTVVRTITPVNAMYAEYFYRNDEEGVYYYYSPLIVLNEKEMNELFVYAFGTDGLYVKIADGTYERDEETGLIQARLVNHYDDVEIRETPVDISSLRSFVFNTAYISTSQRVAPVAYWYSMTDNEGNTTNFDKQYAQKDGDGTLTLVAGFAVLDVTIDGERTIMIGSYVLSDNIFVLVTSSGNLPIEIDEERGTFLLLSSMLGTMYSVNVRGEVSRLEFFTFDGKGGAIFSVVTPSEAEGEDNKRDDYEGTVALADERTALGDPIYRFTSTDGEMTFDFLFISLGSDTYFTKKNETYSGTYRSEEGDRLILDGFGFHAEYTTAGIVYDGVYYEYRENLICFLDRNSSNVFYFDVSVSADGARTVKKRGAEFGSYLIMRNEEILGYVLEFDGYGNYTLMESSEENGREEVASGKYALNDEGMYVFTYEIGSEKTTLVGLTGTLEINSESYSAFFVYYEEVARFFLDTSDLSLIVLDGFGTAVRFDERGIAETGNYLIVSENLFYFSNTAGTDACIYEYDAEAGTAVPSKLTPRGYYTQDLESMLFTDYGFMILEGQTRYYYTVGDGGEVLIYHRDDASPECNEYGFVEESFGKFTAEKEWNGKRYYENSGYMLHFTREEDTEEKYPLHTSATEKTPLGDLNFTPSGSAEFRVYGSVHIGEENYTCIVARTADEEGNVSLTVTVGQYVFDVAIKYTGEAEDGTSNNTYSVTGMRLRIGAPASTYLYLYYLLQMQGISVDNIIGAITITDEYDEEGEVISQTATGVFGAASGMEDSAGAILSFTDIPYTQQGSLYSVEMKGTDGYVYRLHFAIVNTFYSLFGVYSYDVRAFTRVETLTLSDGYEVEIERVILSDSSSIRVGGLYRTELRKDGEAIERDLAFMQDSTLTIIARVKDEESGLFVSATYYVIRLTEKVDESEDDEDSDTLPFYESGALTIRNVKTITGGSADVYADIDTETDEVLLVVFEQIYLIESSEKVGNLYRATVSDVTFEIDPENHRIAKITANAE